MTFNRREFLLFLGASASTLAFSSACTDTKPATTIPTATPSGPSFQPVRFPIPLEVDGLSSAAQMEQLATYEVRDDLVLADGYIYDVIAAWGDPVGESRFGYNNDYVSFVPGSDADNGFLTVNFEYISSGVWMQTFAAVIGASLPFREVIDILKPQNGAIDAYRLVEGSPIKDQIEAIAREALTDLGIGIIGVRRNADGTWSRTNAGSDRRISGIAGLDDGKYLRATGPAANVFAKADKQGYDDSLGDRIIGTFANCAGGTTPWGTVFSAEENFQSQVPEWTYADGSSFDPGELPFTISGGRLSGCANAFGLAGNKYGWVVEVDPANPDDPGTKHTWLGRYRHEAVGIRAVAGKPLALYSGCDRKGGHVYKFISSQPVRDPKNKANSRLFAEGTLYGARFDADGTGQWIPLTPETPVDPVFPSHVVPHQNKGLVALPNPDRNTGGVVIFSNDVDIIAYKNAFATLGDLYVGDNPTELQGALLIDAHNAANAAGITCTARPEDTEVAPDGTVLIAFTAGTAGSTGGPDARIFKGPNDELSYPYGWIMRLEEDDADPAALTFRWEMLAMGGEPADGGAGFTSPDNFALDPAGNIWMVTDLSTSLQNYPLPSRTDPQGDPVPAVERLGVFGNNALWFFPASGPNAGKAYPVAIGPMEAESTGPFLTPDGRTLFMALQHPGERYGTRQDGNAETRSFELQTTNGKTFVQERTVPLGSNWPSGNPNDPPRPAIVAIRHREGGAIAPSV
ncbi:MAG: alkaline phosphatase PhoX [Cyanobacteria bacterium J06641_5]